MKVKQKKRVGAVRNLKVKPFKIELENAVSIRLISVDEVNDEATLEIKLAEEKPVTLYLSARHGDVFYGHITVEIK